MSKTGKITQSQKSKGLGIFSAAISRFINATARYFPMYPSTRVKLQRLRGVKIGKNVFIGADVMFDEVFPEKITIEDDVTIIARCTILSHSFYPTHFSKMLKDKKSKTLLKKGCYLGLGATILPGTTIGQYSIIGAGSVITKDVPDFSIIYGNPGKIKCFICKCGEKIPFNVRSYTCKNCKRKYIKNQNSIKEVKKNS